MAYKNISNNDREEGFREAIDILKTVLVELKEKHTVKINTTNTYGPRRLVGEGRAYQLNKDYQKAEELYQLALRMVDDKFINALIALSELYHEMDQKEKEINSLEQAIKINPHNIHRLTTAAGLYAASGNEERAQKLAEDALKIDPEDAAIYYNIGVVYNQQGNKEDA